MFADLFYDSYVYGFAVIVLAFPSLLVAMWARDRADERRARAHGRAAHQTVLTPVRVH